jgi:hypothetical protein
LSCATALVAMMAKAAVAPISVRRVNMISS